MPSTSRSSFMATKKTTTRSKKHEGRRQACRQARSQDQEGCRRGCPGRRRGSGRARHGQPCAEGKPCARGQGQPGAGRSREGRSPAVAEPAQAPAVAEEKPARARKSKAAEAAPRAAEKPAEAPKADEKPAEAPAPAAEAKPAARPAVLKPRADGGMLREITPRPQQAGNPYKPMLATVVENHPGDRQHQDPARGPGRSRADGRLHL